MRFAYKYSGYCRWLLGAVLAVGGLLGAVSVQAQPSRVTQWTWKPIPDRYIVVYKNAVDDAVAKGGERTAREWGGEVHYSYDRRVKGFAATLSASALRVLKNDPDVDFIEQDQAITINQTSPEANATWGLDRIDQRNLPLDALYYFNGTGVIGNTGARVYAFIIDTGILPTHTEFTGRMAAGYSAISGGTTDCNGHGTHVAGTVGGTTWGVAKGVTLVPVRVLDCSGSGTTSGVISGLQWVTNATSMRPAVANMSLGGGASSALDTAVANAVAAGVTVAVAAGNSNANACNYSPARAGVAITVGASTNGDVRSSYSNYGSCVDLFAPGSSITSAWYTSNSATNTISGTSMATPHVTGVAALVVAANPTATPATVTNLIKTNATPGKLTGIGTGSPNLLLYSQIGASAPPAVKTVAVKSITKTTSTSYWTSTWRATATVTIRDVATGLGVANATVRGAFTVGGSSASCVTGSAGSCSVTTSSLSRSSVPSTTYTVTGVSGSNMAYDPTQNAATQLVITRP